MAFLEIILLNLEHSLLLLSFDTLIITCAVEELFLQLFYPHVKVIGFLYLLLILFVSVNVIPRNELGEGGLGEHV